ncbi:hypothetical protein BOTCAL_0214g00150 [Botryotinia calthae]|uniref:Uncharacterized protein n=1 Tax=Botryotinia calthae TaxID=38488 RepID=A0A4Y8D127_9HELO|nr:hypothetical protein BOTCAL_0214g00150 [Botryotinia calthae]
MSLQAFERDIEVDDWTTSVPPTSEPRRNTVENAVGSQIEIPPHQHYNHDTFQNSTTSGNNDLTSATSSSPYPPHNNVHFTSLLRPEQRLPTPDHISSFMSTLPLLQHTTLSTTCPENLQSNIFQHDTTRDFQYASFNPLPNHPSFSINQENAHHSNSSTISPNNYSAKLCVRSNHEIADELFSLLRTKLTEGENVSVEYKPLFVRDSVLFFYRRYALGPLETLEFRLSIFKSIRDILLNIRIEGREEKSSCILEVVDEAYYEAGWRLHNPVEIGLSNNGYDLGHDAHVPSEAQTMTYGQFYSDPSPSLS